MFKIQAIVVSWLLGLLLLFGFLFSLDAEEMTGKNVPV